MSDEYLVETDESSSVGYVGQQPRSFEIVPLAVSSRLAVSRVVQNMMPTQKSSERRAAKLFYYCLGMAGEPFEKFSRGCRISE